MSGRFPHVPSPVENHHPYIVVPVGEGHVSARILPSVARKRGRNVFCTDDDYDDDANQMQVLPEKIKPHQKHRSTPISRTE